MSSNGIAISVALATYNGERFLQQQLDSIRQQTRPPDEIVVCDDSSSDDTVRILRRARADMNIPIRIRCNPERLGYAKNFSLALSCCCGELVFPCDQDDVWLPNKIERIALAFERLPRMQLLIHDVALCDVNLRSLGITKIEALATIVPVAEEHFKNGMATAIRNSFLRRCLPIPMFHIYRMMNGCIGARRLWQ